MNRCFLLGVVLLGRGLSGCFRAKPAGPPPPAPVVGAQPAKPDPDNPPPPQANKNAGGGGIDLKRTIQKADAMNQTKNIATLYFSFSTDMGHPPATKEEFMEYIKSSAGKEYKSLQEGDFTLVPKAQGGNAVVAYEQNADSNGNHFVAMGDGSVQKMTTQDLRAALAMK